MPIGAQAEAFHGLADELKKPGPVSAEATIAGGAGLCVGQLRARRRHYLETSTGRAYRSDAPHGLHA